MKKILNRFFMKNARGNRPKSDPAKPLLCDQYDVVMHIGAPKTGTSAIQYFLLKNSDLLKKFGFYYPEHGVDKNNVSGGHTELGSHLITDNLLEAENVFNRYISDAKRKNKCLLLSAESFFNHPKSLKRVAADLKIKIIAYFRDPIESLISLYNQAVKRHYCSVTIHRHLKNCLYANHRSISGEIFDTWVDLFGRDHLRLIPYHKNAFPETYIEYSFLDALGIHSDAWIKFSLNDHPTNRSYTTAALELKRLFNLVLDRNENRINHRIDWCLQAYSDAHPEKRKPPEELLGYDLYNAIKEKFEGSNNDLKSKYFPEIPFGFLDYNRISETPGQDAESIDTHNTPSLEAVLLESFENDKDLIIHVNKMLLQKLSNKKRNYSILKLAELFEVGREEIDNWNNAPFSRRQIDIITNSKSGTPDILREVAVVLESADQYRDALRVIDRAIELRPKGPFLIKLKNQLQRKIGSKGCDKKGH